MSIPTRTAALEELQELTDRLVNNRNQLSDLEASVHRLKLETWFGHDSKYITERDRAAEWNALDLTEDMIRLRGEIAGDEDRRLFLRELLSWGD